MKRAVSGMMAVLLLSVAAGSYALTENTLRIGRFEQAAEGSTDWHSSVMERVFASGTGFLAIGTHEVSAQDTAYTLAGKIYAMRFLDNLSPDAAFSPDGKKQLLLPAGYAYRYTNVAPLAGGKFLLTAVAEVVPQSSPDDDHVLVARFNADGSPDTTFATTGARLLALPYPVHAATDSTPAIYSADTPTILVQGDGQLILTGSIATTDGRKVFVARLSANGTLDTTFGGNANGFFVFQPRATGTWGVTSILDAEGRLLVGGESYRPAPPEELGNTSDGFIARLTLGATPQLDTGFNGTGYRILVSSGNSSVGSLLIDGSRILAAHNTDGPGAAQLIRILGDGTLDGAFATAGVASMTAGALVESDILQILLRDGGYVLAGQLGNRRTIMKLTATGSLDTADAQFGGQGYWRTNVSNASAYIGATISAGKLVAVGAQVQRTGMATSPPNNDLVEEAYVVSEFPVSAVTATASTSSSSSSGGGSADGVFLLTFLLLVTRLFRRQQRH